MSMTRPRNPNAGRTCDRCRRPLPRRRQPYGPTAQCARCLAEQRDRQRLARAGERIAYTPLAETLELPSVRLLRALRWFGWVDGDEILAAAGAPESYEDRSAWYQALSRLARAGHIERRREWAAWARSPAWATTYRITAAGRAELARRLTIDMEIADEEPATDERSQAA